MKLIASICVYSLAIGIDLLGIIFLISIVKGAIKRR